MLKFVTIPARAAHALRQAALFGREPDGAANEAHADDGEGAKEHVEIL